MYIHNLYYPYLKKTAVEAPADSGSGAEILTALTHSDT